MKIEISMKKMSSINRRQDIKKISKKDLIKKINRSYVSPFKDYYFELKKLGYGFQHRREDLELFTSTELDMYLLGHANARKKFLLIGNDMCLSVGDENNIAISGAKEVCPFSDCIYIPSTKESLKVNKKATKWKLKNYGL